MENLPSFYNDKEQNGRVAGINAESEGEFGYSAYDGPLSDNKLWNAPLCKNGKQQSPINIDAVLFGNSVINATSFVNNLQHGYKLNVLNEGATVRYTSPDQSLFNFKMIRNGVEYRLDNFHFHTPSEHRINNRHSDTEVHFVFKTDESENADVAVAAFLLNVSDEPNATFDQILVPALVPKEKDESLTIFGPSLGEFFDKNFENHNVHQYVGSLTTPECAEGLKWHVSGVVQPILLKNFLNLRSIMGFNARPVQARPDFAGQAVGASNGHKH
ncbi:5808_t:CDS:2 [Ambispora gerdemannii]|uniref:carbonic anhydrase n=1 Tax=Ambispora gerdemannii TaxID=144530 RepID=A0A9N9G8P5_9GLOM|nr:5808_t:CDS:2 [Ambispora gerdemannii]